MDRGATTPARPAGNGEDAVTTKAGSEDDDGDLPAFAQLVKAIGTGPGRGRFLNRREAVWAFTQILRGEVAEVALGAFLAVMRYRGEAPEELAGFADACRDFHQLMPLPASSPGADLDWPSYASGSLSLSPYQLFAAALVARAGLRVLVHAHAESPARHEALALAAEAAGIVAARDPANAARALGGGKGAALLLLSDWAPELVRLIGLRTAMGMRSPVHSLVKLLNPLAAPATVVGVFHPPYVPLHLETAALIGQSRAVVWKGGGGEAIRGPFKPAAIGAFEAGKGPARDVVFPARLADQRGRRLPAVPAVALAALWQGRPHGLDGETAREAEETIIATAAVGLWVSGRVTDPQTADALAAALWADRKGS